MVKLSRSKRELFLGCPRCFWLDLRKNIKRPASYTINSAIDGLLKKEFDVHRQNSTAHYLIKKYNIEAVLNQSEHIDTWRHNFTGIQFHHLPTDFLVFGAVDDIWVNPKGELIVVDYKSTGANEYKIYDSYRRQLEIYQWLFARNGFRVLKTGYFLFAKVNKANGFADGRLSFDFSLEPLASDYSWVEEALFLAKKTLDGPLAEGGKECPYCQFARNWS